MWNFFRSKFQVEWENGVWTKIRFLASGFFSHTAISLWFLQFFRLFGSNFFLNGFHNPFIVRSWSSFSQWKFFELYVRTCPAVFFYFVTIFVTIIWRHNHFKSAFCSFVHAISTEVRVTSFVALSGASFFLFIRVIKFLVTRLTSLSKLTSSLWSWLLFTLIERDEVKWVCVTLNEGYLRAANTASNNLYRFLIKI